MIDLFTIFTKSGLVLFTHQLTSLKGNPIDELIRSVLLEGRSGEKAFTVDQYAIKWTLANEIGLVFAAVFHKILAPLYVDELLQLVMHSFTKAFAAKIPTAVGKLDYKAEFDAILAKVERRGRGATRHRKPIKAKATVAAASNGKGSAAANGQGSQGQSGAAEEGDEDEDAGSDARHDDTDGLSGVELARRKLRQRGGKSSPRSRGGQGREREGAEKGNGDGNGNADGNGSGSGHGMKKKKKEKRVWHDRAKLTEEEAAKLDYSVKRPGEQPLAHEGNQHLPDVAGEKADIDKSSDEDSDDEAEQAGSSWTAKLSGFFQNLSGQKPLTAEDLAPALTSMQKHLISKNVAVDVAKQLIGSVEKTLVGEKLGSFTKGVNAAVRESMETALERVLTPKRSTDVIRQVEARKSTGEPFSIVFIGVNGVGKSTSLAKVCYYLQNNGLKVMLCACDTFRSGAVEQLKVHSRNLGVHLYDQGYAKDPAGVAMGGLKYAREHHYDVVLIDTAGRMQNNAPLMRALTKLISVNRPNLILFVGEALVGNDGVDQLKLFNKSLRDYSDSADPRTIDGMILTKFDTIDDKVGAAVSMVHNTGQPIMFVGTGQKYTNLNKLNVKKVLKALLSA